MKRDMLRPILIYLDARPMLTFLGMLADEGYFYSILLSFFFTDMDLCENFYTCCNIEFVFIGQPKILLLLLLTLQHE